MVNATPSAPELLTLARAAELLAVRDARTVRALLAAQGLPLVRLGRQLRVREADVSELVAASLAAAPLNGVRDVSADSGSSRGSRAPRRTGRGTRGRPREWKERVERNLYRFHRTSCDAAMRRQAIAPDECDCRWMTRVHGNDVPFTAPTLADARNVASSVHEAAKSGHGINKSVAAFEKRRQTVTLRDFHDHEYRDNAPVLPQTLDRYASSFDLVPDDFVDMPLRDIRPIHVERLARITFPELDRARRAETGKRSASWLSNNFTVVRAVLATALELEYIDTNPALGIEPPEPDPLGRNEREGGSPEKVLTVEQYGQLLVAVPSGYTGWRQRIGCRLGYELGLRSAEDRSPLWRNLDLDRRRLTVEHQWDAENGRLVATKGKRKRDLPMSSDLAEELGEFRAEERRRGFGRDNDFVLRGLKPERPMTASWVVKFMPTLQRRAGLVDSTGRPLITFHGLRHSFATHAIMENVPLKLVSEYLGHKNQAITENTYWFLLPDALEQVAAAFAGVAPRRAR